LTGIHHEIVFDEGGRSTFNQVQLLNLLQNASDPAHRRVAKIPKAMMPAIYSTALLAANDVPCAPLQLVTLINSVGLH
jgi:hypothetical protein